MNNGDRVQDRRGVVWSVEDVSCQLECGREVLVICNLHDINDFKHTRIMAYNDDDTVEIIVE